MCCPLLLLPSAAVCCCLLLLLLTGGYSYGDTKTIAKSLPANVKRYWGMGNH
jgi:hypothetical protein